VTTFKNLRVETKDAIITLTLNRSHALNALTREMIGDLGAAIEQIRADGGVRAVILTGAGRTFSTGADQAVLAQISEGMDLAEFRAEMERWQSVFNALADLPQITIAVINGLTLGGGVELALCCDFRFASSKAIFGMPEIKLGLAPDLGGIARLVRVVGPAHAKELILRGRNISAMEALRQGLVHRVADPGDVMGQARNWAMQMMEYSPRALALTKRLINATAEQPLVESLRAVVDVQMELAQSEAFRAAVKSARVENGG
jgi:enoyl-CoA hydratase